MRKKAPGFTFLEILAVVALMAVVAAIAVGGIRLSSSRLSSDAQQLVQILQATYFQSLKQAKVFRVQFTNEGQLVQVGKFVLPPPPPPKEDEEAYREWQEARDERQKALRELSIEERQQLTLLDRGEFEIVQERELGSGIKVSKLLHREKDADNQSILFFPTGQMQQVLIVLEDEDGNAFSLTTNSITGRVTATKGVLPEEEWNKAASKE